MSEKLSSSTDTPIRTQQSSPHRGTRTSSTAYRLMTEMLAVCHGNW